MAADFSYLTITAEHNCQRSLLCLWGELDVGNRADLYQAVRTTLDVHSPPVLVLDLSALSFADCAGLAVITWAHKRQQEHGRRLLVTGARPIVRRIMRLTGLAAYLNLDTAGEGLLSQPPC